jgi:hypothetical protein
LLKEIERRNLKRAPAVAGGQLVPFCARGNWDRKSGSRIDGIGKQIAANRRNATKSTGPRTQAGKERSKMIALRHGLALEDFASERALDLEELHCG